MIYNGIELSDNGQALVCPKCNNEKVSGTFCQVCGTNLYNRCSNSNCGTILTGNARYCPQCGFESTFLKENLLKSWDSIKPKEVCDYDIPF